MQASLRILHMCYDFKSILNTNLLRTETKTPPKRKRNGVCPREFQKRDRHLVFLTFLSEFTIDRLYFSFIPILFTHNSSSSSCDIKLRSEQRISKIEKNKEHFHIKTRSTWKNNIHKSPGEEQERKSEKTHIIPFSDNLKLSILPISRPSSEDRYFIVLTVSFRIKVDFS